MCSVLLLIKLALLLTLILFYIKDKIKIMSQYPMTVHGADALREELNHLKTVKRPRIVADIADGA